MLLGVSMCLAPVPDAVWPVPVPAAVPVSKNAVPDAVSPVPVPVVSKNAAPDAVPPVPAPVPVAVEDRQACCVPVTPV